MIVNALLAPIFVAVVDASGGEPAAARTSTTRATGGARAAPKKG